MQNIRPISEISRALGVEPKYVSAHGESKAKIKLEAIQGRERQGKLIVVTGVTPTPAGEGKTTTAIGLTQGLAKLGHRAVVTLRQPTLGPVFGIKGGGTGGGLAKVLPEDEINLHLTGDAHAVGSAHNLLAALVDNATRRGGKASGLRPQDITWRRVTDVSDRALRSIVSGVGGNADGPLRQTGFDIVPASEIMAILALANSRDDLRDRLSQITVGLSADGTTVTASDVGAVGSMMALLRDALEPNLVQTTEGQPALVHTGPFGNIAHGCNSVLADELALCYADYAITEAGFGADLGFEKFMHIKARGSGMYPSAAVLVTTIKALRWHGGVPADSLDRPDPLAVNIGVGNLVHMIELVRAFGLPVVVAINRFPSDATEEVVVTQDAAISAGAAAAVECTGFADGGTGAVGLAEAVDRVSSGETPVPSFLYEEKTSLSEKVQILATKVYGASTVRWNTAAARNLERIEARGLGHLPICMAKTPLSLSHDPAMRNRPNDYTFQISDVRASTGAGFVYPIAGSISTMPGLPTNPRQLDVDDNGNIIGL